MLGDIGCCIREVFSDEGILKLVLAVELFSHQDVRVFAWWGWFLEGFFLENAFEGGLLGSRFLAFERAFSTFLVRGSLQIFFEACSAGPGLVTGVGV